MTHRLPPIGFYRALTGAIAASVFINFWTPGAVAKDRSADRSKPSTFARFSPDAAAPARFFTISAVLAKYDSKEEPRISADLRLASLRPTTPATDVTEALPTIARHHSNEPFGLSLFRAPEGILWRKWRHVDAELVREKTVLENCRADAASCPSYAAQFLRLVAAVKSKSGVAQIEEANRSVNAAIRYVNDLTQHREVDRWSSPLATFASAKGDCEDYAIAKYVALTEAGFSQADLRFLLVRDRSVRQDHAVLAARFADRWHILDNRYSGLIDDTEASNFAPLFAITDRGVHMFVAPYARIDLDKHQGDTTPAAETSHDGMLVSAWSTEELEAARIEGIDAPI